MSPAPSCFVCDGHFTSSGPLSRCVLQCCPLSVHLQCVTDLVHLPSQSVVCPACNSQSPSSLDFFHFHHLCCVRQVEAPVGDCMICSSPQTVKYKFIKTTFIKKNFSSKSTFIKNHFHQKPLSSKTNFIKKPLSSKCHFHQKPLSSETTFIKNQFHQRPLSSKTNFIKNQFHQSTSCQRDPPPEQKQHIPCLCESVAGRRPVTPSHKHGLCPPLGSQLAFLLNIAGRRLAMFSRKAR